MMPTSREAVLRRRLREGTPSEIQRLVRRIQVGDFLLLHLLGQNIGVKSYGEILSSLFNSICDPSSNTPSAPSTLEMAPIYPEISKYGKESET